MTRTGRWLVRGAAGLVATGVVGAALVAWWMPSDAELAARVRSEFLALAAAEPERFLVLDASRPAEAIAASVRARVEELLA